MKLVLFNDDSLGVLKDGSVYDVSDIVKDIPYVTAQDLVNGVIAGFARLRPALEKVSNSSAGVPVSQVRLRPPLPRPGKIVAMAVNYLEFGLITDPSPIHAFLKSSDAVIGPGDTIVLPEAEADIFHHEAELGIVIGKEARGVKEADAFDYIFGYVNFIDVSARGLAGGSFFWGKSWDTFAPLGPALVTAEEVSSPQDLQVKLWVNGDLRHDFSTSDMAHSIARCVEWASSVTTLDPGDVITTGTNHQGIGPVQDGDLVEMEIQGLERLTLHVEDSLKRQWPRGIDKRFADKMAGRG